MMIGEFLHKIRHERGYGIREVCSLVERSKFCPGKISPAYLSRIERGGGGEIETEKITIDKLWALGVILGVSPLLLFAISRHAIDIGLFKSGYPSLFKILDVPAGHIGHFLRSLRHSQSMSLAEACSLAATLPHAQFGISPGFLSQVETDHRGMSSKISGEKLWALGVVFSVDPLALFVLSRNIDFELNAWEKRLFLFPHFSI